MNHYLIRLDWPEAPFRLNANDLQKFRELFGGEVEAAEGEDDFLAKLPEATHVVCWEFKRKWFETAKQMRVLATPGAGRELMPQDEEMPEGVQKIHGTFHGAIMSETVIAYMLAWCRGLYFKSEKLWPRVEIGPCCRTLAGTKAVILGYGHIGKAVGAKLEALGVETVGIGRQSIGRMWENLPTADWLICVLPASANTDDIVDGAVLAKMKREAVVINVGRGNAIDEGELKKALVEGRIAAAFLDVVKDEPMTRKSTLAGKIPNLHIFPHCSAFAPDYLQRFFMELKCSGEFQ